MYWILAWILVNYSSPFITCSRRLDIKVELVILLMVVWHLPLAIILQFLLIPSM